MTQDQAIAAGANDVLPTPLDKSLLLSQVENARNLLRLTDILEQEEDLYGGKGSVPRIAFEQLFLTAIDRAGRYGEVSYLIDILGIGSESVLQNLADFLIGFRRRSDLLAQIEEGEFCFLLARPYRETEPVDALRRLAEELIKHADQETKQLNIKARLIELPSGRILDEYDIG